MIQPGEVENRTPAERSWFVKDGQMGFDPTPLVRKWYIDDGKELHICDDHGLVVPITNYEAATRASAPGSVWYIEKAFFAHDYALKVDYVNHIWPCLGITVLCAPNGAVQNRARDEGIPYKTNQHALAAQLLRRTIQDDEIQCLPARITAPGQFDFIDNLRAQADKNYKTGIGSHWGTRRWPQFDGVEASSYSTEQQRFEKQLNDRLLAIIASVLNPLTAKGKGSKKRKEAAIEALNTNLSQFISTERARAQTPESQKRWAEWTNEDTQKFQRFVLAFLRDRERLMRWLTLADIVLTAPPLPDGSRGGRGLYTEIGGCWGQGKGSPWSSNARKFWLPAWIREEYPAIANGYSTYKQIPAQSYTRKYRREFWRLFNLLQNWFCLVTGVTQISARPLHTAALSQAPGDLAEPFSKTTAALFHRTPRLPAESSSNV